MKYYISRKKRILSGLLAFIMSGLIPVSAYAAITNEKIEETSEKIKMAEELKKETEAQKQAIDEKKDNLEEQKSELQNYLTSLNDNLESISDNLDAIENRISGKEAEITLTLQDIEEAKGEEERQYDLMKKRVRYMYEKGDMSLLETFAAASSFADFLNKAEYVSKVEAYDKKMFEELVSIREDIEEKEAVLEGEKQELDGMRQEVLDEQDKVSALVTSTSGSLAETTGAITAAEMEQNAKEAEIKAQEENLAALKKQLAEEQAMAARAAKMAWRDVSELTFEEGDRDLLACLIYCEAGSEPYTGQVAVGAVVINRMRSAAYPNTMVGVIYQNRQFSPVASGRLATRLTLGASEQCYKAADEAMKGSTPVGNCLYFRTVIPEINGQIIGGHVFY
ncbi:MAG: cell wall hydrolase [Lachnospiraceae bacterium]|nr:cell wall hydrolase [Lachnospiraceae bacterium]